jgi:hypothetical protein
MEPMEGRGRGQDVVKGPWGKPRRRGSRGAHQTGRTPPGRWLLPNGLAALGAIRIPSGARRRHGSSSRSRSSSSSPRYSHVHACMRESRSPARGTTTPAPLCNSLGSTSCEVALRTKDPKVHAQQTAASPPPPSGATPPAGSSAAKRFLPCARSFSTATVRATSWSGASRGNTSSSEDEEEEKAAGALPPLPPPCSDPRLSRSVHPSIRWHSDGVVDAACRATSTSVLSFAANQPTAPVRRWGAGAHRGCETANGQLLMDAHGAAPAVIEYGTARVRHTALRTPAAPKPDMVYILSSSRARAGMAEALLEALQRKQ